MRSLMDGQRLIKRRRTCPGEAAEGPKAEIQGVLAGGVPASDPVGAPRAGQLSSGRAGPGQEDERRQEGEKASPWGQMTGQDRRLRRGAVPPRESAGHPPLGLAGEQVLRVGWAPGGRKDQGARHQKRPRPFSPG